MEFSIFAVIVILVGLSVRGAGLLYAQFLFCVLGAASAVTLPALGGASVTAPWLFSVFLITRSWLERPLEDPWFRLSRASAWIGLVALWGIVSSYFVPRWLAGSVEILTIDRGLAGVGPVLMPLRPVSGNITQTGYAIGSALAFMSVRALILRKPDGIQAFRDAALLLAVVNCLGAFINLGEFYAGIPPILPYVRTGAYTIFEAYEAGGLVRIQGTFPETAVFSAFTLPLFVFAAHLWLRHERPLYSGLIAATSLLLLLISTSATAYVGLIGYLAVFAGGLAFRALGGHAIPRAYGVMVVSLSTALLIGFTYAFELEPGAAVGRFVESTLLKKMDSASGVERSIWNAHAWSNFLETYGMGVGLGGARASSFVLVLLSNLGLVGTLFFVGFLYEVFRGRSLPHLDPIPHAARHAVIANLIAAAASCSVFDIGFCFYAFCAASTCISPVRDARHRKPSQPQRKVWLGPKSAMLQNGLAQ